MQFTLPAFKLTHALTLMRITIAGIFMAHAIARIAYGTIPQFGGFMESKGFAGGQVWVWMITVFEIGGGALLLLGKWQRLLAYLFIVLLLAGIVLIHAHLGWWVGEHGDGGNEYSVALIAALLVLAAEKK